MTNIHQEILAKVGPYKGFAGAAEFDCEAKLFHGQVLGMRDVVTFQAASINELLKAFTESVDDYLDFCAKRKEAPEKPYSGRFVARINADLHRRVAEAAVAADTSINEIVVNSLEAALRSGGFGSDRSRKKMVPIASKPGRRKKSPKSSGSR